MDTVSGGITVNWNSVHWDRGSLTYTINNIKEKTVQEVFGVPDKDYDRSRITLTANKTNLNVSVEYINRKVVFVGQITEITDYQIDDTGKIKAFKIKVRDISGTGISSIADSVTRIDPVISEILVIENAMTIIFSGDYEAISKNDCEWIKDRYGIVEHMGTTYYYHKAKVIKLRYNAADVGSDISYHNLYVCAIYHVNPLANAEDIDHIDKILRARTSFISRGR